MAVHAVVSFMKQILTLTLNPTIDMSSSVENVFPEHKLRCSSPRNEPGGGGINVSRAIEKLGGHSVAVHYCGGPTGDILRTLLDAEGVAHDPIAIAGLTRLSVAILETTTGQQYRFVFPGPIFSEAEWRGALAHIAEISESPDLIVASGSLPPGVPNEFYGLLAQVVREKRGRMVLDTSGSCLSAALEAGVFLVKPSLRELRSFAGSDLEHEGDQERAAMKIVENGGAEVVVVSLGAAGVLFASQAGCERMRSPTVPVRSKIGAGDSMVAGIALGLARDYSLRDAVRLGIAAGAAAVMTSGTELCRREDAERLFRQIE